MGDVKLPAGCLNRAGFMELIMKFAKFLYSSSENMRINEYIDIKEVDVVSNAKALQTFVKKKLEPYYEKIKNKWQEFRDDELW